jgi:hypothetical protein
MQRMGLTNVGLQAYHRALCRPHSIRVMVSLCDLEENPLESITPVIVDGQVTYDVDAEVTRMLSLQLLDPHHDLNIDTRRPTDGALFLDRIVKVYYSIWVEELHRRVTCQVFTGVPWNLSRSGPLVTIEAHGKERLALRAAWRTFHRAKGANTAQTIRALLRERAGEDRFGGAFDTHNGRLGRPFNVARSQITWDRARKLANAIDRQLYYPGNGRCTLRKLPDKPLLTLSADPASVDNPAHMMAIVEDIVPDTNVEDFVNAVLVKGKKKTDPVVVKLDDRHPLSAQRLARNGVPGVIGVFEENSQLNTRAKQRRRGANLLDRRGQTTVNVSYGTLPLPHLEENDPVRVITPDGVAFTHRMRQWALPLATEGAPPMTVGYTRRLTPARRRIRRR